MLKRPTLLKTSVLYWSQRGNAREGGGVQPAEGTKPILAGPAATVQQHLYETLKRFAAPIPTATTAALTRPSVDKLYMPPDRLT